MSITLSELAKMSNEQIVARGPRECIGCEGKEPPYSKEEVKTLCPRHYNEYELHTFSEEIDQHPIGVPHRR